MEITFWGTRGSIPSPGKNTVKYGGNTTSISISLESGSEIVIDAGTGIRLLGEEILAKGIKHIDFFLTHSHWDHIQGFPFFTPAYHNDFSMNIYGASPTFERLLEILRGQMESIYYPVQFGELGAEINFKKIKKSGIKVNSVKIDSVMTNHPLETHALKFEENGKILVFMTDNELDHPDIANVPYEEHIKFVRNADILIHDAQYRKEEVDKYKGWGHSSWEEVIKFSREANIKRLYLTHHAPSRTDGEIDRIIKEANKVSGNDLNVYGAKEGESLKL